MDTQPELGYTYVCQQIVDSIKEGYLKAETTDDDFIETLKQATFLVGMVGVSATEYLRQAIRALKEIGQHQLARRVHDEVYMPIIMAED